MIEKVVAFVKLLRLLVIAAVVLGLILVGIILLAPPQIASTLRSILAFLFASLGFWQLIGAIALLMILYFWLRDSFAMDAPDANGLLPVPRRVIRQRPQLALAALEAYHHAKLTRSTQLIPDGVQSVNLSPRIQTSVAPMTDPPLLPPPLPTAPDFAQILHQGWRPSLQQFLLGYDLSGPVHGTINDLLSTGVIGKPGNGKSTAERFLLAQAYAAGARVAVIDLQGSIIDLAPREMFSLVAEYDHEVADVVAIILDEIAARDVQYKQGSRDFEPFLLVTDELHLLVDSHPEVLELFKRIILHCRKYGMFAMICGHGLPAKYFGESTVRDSISTKYIFYTTPRQASMAGMDDLSVAKELLAALKTDPVGRAILDRVKADPVIVAIPNTTSADLEALHRPLPTDTTPPAPPLQDSAAESPGNAGNVSADVLKSDDLAAVRNVTGLSEHDIIKILALLEADVPRSQIHKHVVGGSGGDYWKIKAVADAVKLDDPAARWRGGRAKAQG